MNKLVPAVVSLTCLMMLGPPSASAAQQCAEVESAKVALRANSSLQAGARSQDVQSPRNQDTQSPRGQGVQSSRSQDVQSPRNQDVQSPRGQQPAPQSAQQRQQATQLVSEAAAACDAGNPSVASQKAREAMALLRR
jgi:hypothetical protein